MTPLKPWKDPFRWRADKTPAEKRRWAIRKSVNARAKAQNAEGEDRLADMAWFYERALDNLKRPAGA